MNHSVGPIICVMAGLLIFWNNPAMSQVSVESNVSYSSVLALDFTDADKKLVYGEDNPDLQYGLLWLPGKHIGVEKAPLIVLIHGGCWLNAYDIQHSYALSSALANAGYAVWSLEYRRSGDEGGGWPGTFEDIKLGVAFTSELERFPVDLNRLVIMGHSAGGHLALLAATEIAEVDAVVGLAAITDIVSYSQGKNSCQTATVEFMGGHYEDKPSAYQAANPVGNTLHGNTVLLQGTKDVIVPPDQAQVTGATTRLVDGAGHFDWVHPGTEAYQVLLSTLEEIFRE